MRLLASIACALAVLSCLPANARTITITPIFTRTHVTKAWFYDDAARQIMDNVRRGTGGSHGAALAAGRGVYALNLRDQRVRAALAMRPKLSQRAWASLPRPKAYFGPIPAPSAHKGVKGGFRVATLSPQVSSSPTQVTIQEIALSRFDDQDCVLYPYIFTLNYNSATGGLLSETATLATQSQAAAANLPGKMNVC